MGLVRRLIELVRLAGKSVDIFNYMQQTPLHLACIMKDPDVIRLLVEAGANPNEADRNGQTSAHHACKNDNPGCLGAILRYSQVDVNLNIRNYEGYTPLHLAAMIGNPTLVTMLLEKGADINSKDSKNGWTPLFHAVTNQDTKLVHKMLSSGAEVNIQSYSGNTVLHVATGRGYTDIVKILVHYGADMSLKNTQWDTPATITTDKNMSSLLRGLGAGSPQTPETSSPSTPAPILPMPLNDAYLIRPTPVVDPTGSPVTGSATPTGTSPSKAPTVTTMTTERLKGSPNEVYTVTRSVTHQDGSSPSPDGQQQRAMHKQLQEKLRHSIQCRKFVNEMRSESMQRITDSSPGGGSGSNEKVVVVIPAKKDREGRISVIIPPAAEGLSSPQDEAKRVSFLTDLEKRLNATGVKVMDSAETKAPSPTHRASSDPVPVADKAISSKSTPDVVPTPEDTSGETSDESVTSKSAVHQGVRVEAGSPEEKMDTSEASLIEMRAGSTLPPSANGDLRTLGQRTSPNSKRNPMATHNALSETKHPKREEEPDRRTPEERKKSPELIPRGSKNSCVEATFRSAQNQAPESESEIRARMLSLQYKNSDAILGNRYERKLDSVGSEQEHEAVTAMLAMGSGFREHSPWQKQHQQHQVQQQQQLEQPQRSHQTCDADSTVKAEPISPTPVLSSTSDEVAPAPPPPGAQTEASAAAAAAAAAAAERAATEKAVATLGARTKTQSPHAWPQTPPVLECEGDCPPPLPSTDDDADDEPSLVIDESFRANSRKRSRTPPKAGPPSSAQGNSPDLAEESRDSPQGKQGNARAVGESNIVWKKKAMMAMKRKRTEKSSS